MIPRPAATLIVVRPATREPEVLMVKRPSHGFFGGLWVFPGGALEPIDEGDLARRAVAVPEDADDVVWRAAALRETVEEVGLALTEPPLMEAIDAMGGEVYERVLSRGAVLDGTRLRLLSQWVTPKGLPTRYDARFYLAMAGEVPALRARPAEIADIEWVSASRGLDRLERGEWAMARPTIHHLRWLAGFPDPDRIWEASARAEGRRVEPTIESDGSEVLVRLPASAQLP